MSACSIRLFDTHCHLDFSCFEADFAAMWQRAEQVGVTRAVVPGVGPNNWPSVLALTKRSPAFYCALGFHPYFLQPDFADHLASLARLLAQHSQAQGGRCVAIGECGLDSMVDVPMPLQEQALLAQFELARRTSLPVILHSRGCHNRLIQLVKQAKLPKGGVIHAFSGSYQQGMEWVKLGFYLGVGGTITYPRAKKTRAALKQLPINNLVIETDSPDMPICGFQDQVNEPKNVHLILESIALLREVSPQTFAEKMWENSNSLFSICE